MGTWTLQSDCDWGGTTCGASYCTNDSTADKCDKAYLKTDGTGYTDWTETEIAAKLATITAKTCTQATSSVDERCSADWLNTWMSSGRDGIGGALAAYCNDKYLIIIGTGKPGHTTNMNEISQAPSGKYYPSGTETACVTSEVTTFSDKLEESVIPLVSGDYKYTLLTTAANTNNMDAYDGGGDGSGLYLDNTDIGLGDFGLPSWAGVGVTVTGQSIYPLYSNVAQITLDACEVDTCNEHVGQGGGQPHLHGDPFHASDSKCLYGPANYTDGTTGHPPVIGFSFDGPTIYGRYLSESAPGFSVGLDDCGGHEHGDYVYHYHTQIIEATTSEKNKGTNGAANEGVKYPAFTPGPYKCWRADIDLRGTSSFDFFDNAAVSAADRKPCNGMTHYWVKTGYSIDGAGTLDTTLATCDASAAPTNGGTGDCTSTLASGSTCQPTCDMGYTVSGTSSCSDGTLTAATCVADPCDASAAPTNGGVGNCTSTLASSSMCQPTCDTGYTVSGTSSCSLGTLTAATCSANACDASAAPTNGGVGDCTSTLASGSKCQPTCDTGYTVSGTSSCTAGTFTSALCTVAPSPPPPSPPPPAQAAVQATIQLTGYSSTEFDDAKQTAFKIGMGEYLSVDPTAITITSVTDVASTRRKLLAADSVLNVEFTVEATTFSDTTSLETKLIVTDATDMTTKLTSAGLTVSAIVPPTTITSLAPPPPPPPPPSPPPSPPLPSSSASLLSIVELIAATVALAFFTC